MPPLFCLPRVVRPQLPGAISCASRVYFYKLSVGEFSQTMRMTLVK